MTPRRLLREVGRFLGRDPGGSNASMVVSMAETLSSGVMPPLKQLIARLDWTLGGVPFGSEASRFVKESATLPVL